MKHIIEENKKDMITPYSCVPLDSDSSLDYSKKQERIASFELLRIISMLMIIALHFLGHGGILKNTDLFSLNYFIAWIIESFAFVSVNCYVLISGYFLINSKFSIKKLIALYMQIWIYSFLIYIIFSATGVIVFDIKSFIYTIIPVSTNEYWFVTVYIPIYLLSPFINISIKSMTKKQLQFCIFILLMLFSVVPNIIFFKDSFNVNEGYSIYWFVCLYFVAGYIRLHYVPKYNKKKWMLYYLILCLLLTLSRIVFSIISPYALGIIKVDLFYLYNSILVAPASICLFLCFVNWNISGKKIRKFICFISPLTFGVYLIHDNKYMRQFIWEFLFKPFTYANKPNMIFYLIVSVIYIFITSALIELVRQILFKPIENSKKMKGLVERLNLILSDYDYFN